MLTAKECANTAQELQENFKRLGYPMEQVAKDVRLNAAQVEAILLMANPQPGHVWMLRDYLEDMLKKDGKNLYPFTRLADHSANRWFSYDTPWRFDEGDRK
ncbi:DUF2316 family protein [Streptococcus dentiloxodontae]